MFIAVVALGNIKKPTLKNTIDNNFVLKAVLILVVALLESTQTISPCVIIFSGRIQIAHHTAHPPTLAERKPL